jgi:hypothetical protein
VLFEFISMGAHFYQNPRKQLRRRINRCIFNVKLLYFRETPEQPAAKDQIVEDEVFDKPTEKVQDVSEKEPGDKPRTEEEPEKSKADEKVAVDEKLEDENPTAVSPEEDTSISPEKDTPQDEPTEKATEGKDVSEASIPDTAQSIGENEAAKETDAPKTTSEGDEVEEVSEKPKDTNDNETDTSEDSTTKAEPSTTEAESDDVIKSSVNKELLEEVLTSAKDTSL